MSHAKRAYLALKLNKQQAEGAAGVVRVEASEDLKKGQTVAPHPWMLLWPGLRLTGCRRDSTDQRQVQNNCAYRVVSVDSSRVVVALEVEGAQPIQLSQQEAVQFLRLDCCRCYASVQGMTLRDRRLLLCDVRHRFMCARKLYVAVSRVTDGRFLHVATREQERALLTE